jgi:hypothetical protein
MKLIPVFMDAPALAMLMVDDQSVLCTLDALHSLYARQEVNVHDGK